jgi:rhodanese-related sulfurtransferase
MNSPQEISQITVEAFAQRLATASTANLQLIDVREPGEVEIASLSGFQVLPLSDYGDWSNQIHDRFDPHQETIVMCHHGMRSAQMCQWLIGQGFTNVKNLAGGIDAYAAIVDPSIPRY